MIEPAYDIVIRGGRVATATDVFEADVAVAGETVAAVGRGLPVGKRESDARAANWFCPAASTATPISNSFRPRAS